METKDENGESVNYDYASSETTNHPKPEYVAQAVPVSDSETCDRRTKDDIESDKSTPSNSTLGRCNSLTGAAILNASSKYLNVKEQLWHRKFSIIFVIMQTRWNLYCDHLGISVKFWG